MSELSNRLKNIRENRKVKQKDIAKALGISPQTLSKYETGVREPDIATIMLLAKYYDVSVDYLVGFVNNQNISKKSIETYLENIENEIAQLRKYVNNAK